MAIAKTEIPANDCAIASAENSAAIALNHPFIAIVIVNTNRKKTLRRVYFSLDY